MRNATRKSILGVSGAAVIATLMMMISGAYADTIEVTPDTADGQTVTRDLATKCDAGAADLSCTWSNTSVRTLNGSGEVVGANGAQKFVNCGTGVLRETITWSRTVGHEVTFGNSITFGRSLANLFTKMETETGLNLSGTWSRERTFGSSTQIEVPVGETGFIVHSEARVIASGTLTVVAGQNTFVLPKADISAPHAKDIGAISSHTRKHTASDAAICNNAPAPAGVSAAGFDA